MEPLFIIAVLMGGFCIAGGVYNWDWFMNDRKAALFVTLLGRDGARVLYIFLGIGLIGWAIWNLLLGSG
jgi:hypothetical protein